MKLRFLSLLCVLTVFACSCIRSHSQSAPQSANNSGPVQLQIDVPTKFMFVAYGDMRISDPANKGAGDAVRRKMLIDEIARIKPAFLTISGDLVANGSVASDWQQFDSETKPWRDAKLPIVPALGNHDVRGDINVALGNYFERFPQLQRSRYYTARAGNVLIIALDSTQSDSDGPQFEWLKKQIAGVPTGVDFVMITLHHPPYTKSHERVLGGGHSARPQEQALAAWLEQQQAKTRARFVVVAGHVHNYERYEHGGVLYITSGGGGATPYMIARSADDAYRAPGPTYHYCKVSVDGPRMTIEMVRLDVQGEKASFSTQDSVTLEAQKAKAATAALK